LLWGVGCGLVGGGFVGGGGGGGGGIAARSGLSDGALEGLIGRY
jgi:hypothetical protein